MNFLIEMRILFLLLLVDLISSSELSDQFETSYFENEANPVSGKRAFGCVADMIPFCLPDSGSRFETKFVFHSKSNRKAEVKNQNFDSSHLRNFDAKLPTKVIIHGYSLLSGSNEAYSKNMMTLVNAYLDHHNVNVIVVDWTAGSSDINYCTSKSRVSIVGKAVATFLDQLLRSASSRMWEQLTIVGFSLGTIPKAHS